ncbi:MAG: NADH-quinone oxidoreductase subunit NuoF [Dehalococcoidia bacterium]|nr:NADH-quinone oxidoreductase subunit NuoF [Dehalococcoidia bacterium]
MRVLVCQGTGCTSSRSEDIRRALEDGVRQEGLSNVEVDFTGCHGFCQQGPIVVVEPEGIFYTHVRVEDAAEIVNSHLKRGIWVERLFYQDPATGEAIATYREVNFYKRQSRLILRNCGHINPERIEDYIATGGYDALKKALFEMTPEAVIEEIRRSGLRGRGGAGFPTALKWEFCRNSSGSQKYVICNADEGDPGAFMDRSIMEADPHTVIEGLAIAAYAIGSSEGYVYCRAEYPLAMKRLRIAIGQAGEKGFLGKNILGSQFDFTLHIKEGAGAFVCGEETALMASIEGKRGMPRSRPPFPAQSGLWGKPTNINNVKTLASIPVIVGKGADWYASIGTEKSKGTAVFALTGKVANAGLIEIPMGVTLRELIFEIGGGVPGGKRFKAVQTGGPSGGCLPASLLDLPIDYESLAAAGSIMGSGGMVVTDEDTCMVDMARFFLSFTQLESCGKCIPCRWGTKQMLDILEDIANGRGRPDDIELLEELAESVKDGSLCGLGQTAPNPVLTSIRHFRREYEDHIKRHHCSAAVCKGLVKAPCSHTCPAGVDVPRYLRFIGLGQFDSALAVIREKIPFPSICGHVCPHPCEAKCRRGQVDETIAIRALKRAAAEQGNGLWKLKVRAVAPTGKRVAVIGAGPAGLTAAYYLARRGHGVTVFEALSEPGGMMRYGIPEYRLPREILAQEIGDIRSAGVEIRTNTRISSVDDLLGDGYHAVFLAIGAHQGTKLGIEGEACPGVIEGVAFLREVNSGSPVSAGRDVAVVGGGNAAIDVARSALRLGAGAVTVIYRRTRDEMPASSEEIEEAIHEGVKFEFLAAPARIERRSGTMDLTCVRMELGEADFSGRRRPVMLPGSEFSMAFDTIIAAIGQMPEAASTFGLSLKGGNTFESDPDSLATGRDGVFAGGDAVTGPATVIEAIAAGRQAAVSIDKYLGGTGIIDEVLAPAEDLEALPELQEGERHRVCVSTLALCERLGGFAEVELGLSREAAMEEASRCLRCDLEED